MKFTFRPAGPDDIERVIELMREFYAYEHREFSFSAPLNEAAARPLLAQVFNDPRWGRVWLIEAGADLAGYAAVMFCLSLEFGGRVAVVDELYVRDSYRGQGAGTRALQMVEDFCRAEGVGALMLEVDRTNARAQAVYRKAGFVDRNNLLLCKWL